MKIFSFARGSREGGDTGIVVAKWVVRGHSWAESRGEFASRYALEPAFSRRRRRLNLTVSRQPAKKSAHSEGATPLCHALTTAATVRWSRRISEWILRIIACSAQLLRPLLSLLVPPENDQCNNQEDSESTKAANDAANDLRRGRA